MIDRYRDLPLNVHQPINGGVETSHGVERVVVQSSEALDHLVLHSVDLSSDESEFVVQLLCHRRLEASIEQGSIVEALGRGLDC